MEAGFVGFVGGVTGFVGFTGATLGGVNGVVPPVPVPLVGGVYHPIALDAAGRLPSTALELDWRGAGTTSRCSIRARARTCRCRTRKPQPGARPRAEVVRLRAELEAR